MKMCDCHSAGAGVLLSVLLLAACATPAAWVRPGADSAQVDQDRRDCGRFAAEQAERDSWRYANPFLAPPMFPGHDLDWFEWQQEAQLDYAMHREALQNACMRARGYQLLPLPPRAG
jgi:hypothetical protein